MHGSGRWLFLKLIYWINKMIDIEDLILLLKATSGVGAVSKVCFDDYGFSRTIQFTCLESEYTIEWWSNVSYLKIGSLSIPFDKITNKYTWPTFFKTQLQFYYKDRFSCVLGTEKREV